LAQQSTFLEELMAAGRGVISLLVGDRRAGSFFDFSRRGLIGSFIAFLAASTVAAYLPLVMGDPHPGAAVAAVQIAILFAVQLGCTALMLRQIKRLDTLVPYLIADNWMNFFVALLLGACLAAGLGGEVPTIIFGIAAIVIEVNIGRLIMTLSPLQIAMLIIAQVVGLLIGSAIVFFVFPLPPEATAQLLVG